MNVLVTGGCGFVGSNLSIFLKKKLNCNVFSLDNLSRRGSSVNLKRLKKNKIINFNRNISNKNAFKNLPCFDIVIDCCAEAAIDYSKNESRRVFNTNLIGTFNLLEKIKKDKSKIIFVSTSRVYSILKINNIFVNNYNKKYSINEKFSTGAPISIYGFTKLSSEMLIQEYSYLYNLKYIINRCGVISGPWQFGKIDQGFISYWCWNYLNNIKKITFRGYNGSGNQIRDVLHIDDFNNLILKQILKFDKIFNIIFNVGGGRKSFIKLIKLSKICEKISGNIIKIKKVIKTSNYDIPCYISNITKVSKFYNWTPKKKINEIVIDNFLWQKNNIKKIYKYFN